MWTTNDVHDVSSTQTALAGTYQTNNDGRIPKYILYGELTAGNGILGVSSYATEIYANGT